MHETKIYYKTEDQIKITNNLEIIKSDKDKILWIDLLNPGELIKNIIEDFYDFDFKTDREIEEIESSSRYSETFDFIIMNTNFASLDSDDNFVSDIVSIMISKDILITLRQYDYFTFDETERKLKIKHHLPRTSYDIMALIWEIRIDYEADLLENITKKINYISHRIVERDFDEELLAKINQLQEYSMIIRESIIDKQRIVSNIIRSTRFPRRIMERMRILMKDIISLLEYNKFNFERLEYLQGTVLGYINSQQNKVIKIFTVLSVIFLPPTLIASIYGMNFRYMPELQWEASYPISILLMLISSLGTLLYFKRKKWL
ncbi:MAG: magnesium/cobalt transporter CorA [Bacteroidales bacterium]|nr:magnesium/cobalt transporter CorA [Bacteroidales bacterium]